MSTEKTLCCYKCCKSNQRAAREDDCRRKRRRQDPLKSSRGNQPEPRDAARRPRPTDETICSQLCVTPPCPPPHRFNYIGNAALISSGKVKKLVACVVYVLGKPQQARTFGEKIFVRATRSRCRVTNLLSSSRAFTLHDFIITRSEFGVHIVI